MIQAVSGLAAAFGLSTSAGLNAYVPLLIVALAARYTSLIRLSPPFSALTSGWVILVLVLLLAIEVVADKIPVVDSVNDVVQSVIRPAAGAILFAAATRTIVEIHPILAMICGVILAGGVHVVKATARPVITATTGGMLNPVVSAGEDAVAAVTSLAALVAPLFGALIALAILGAAFVLWRRRQTGRSAGGA